MYSRLFGVGFTLEFAVFPIAQNSVFSVRDFPLTLSFPFISPVPWYPAHLPGGSRGAGMGREDAPRLHRDLLNSGAFSLGISWRVSLPQVGG